MYVADTASLQQRLSPSCSAPRDPNCATQSSWTCSASSHHRHLTPSLLPPVLMFNPTQMSTVQKPFFFTLQFSFTLIPLLFPVPSLCPSPLSIFSTLTFPSWPCHIFREDGSSTAGCQLALRALPSLFHPINISVSLDVSLQTKTQPPQRCQQQRLSHFQVYLGFI